MYLYVVFGDLKCWLHRLLMELGSEDANEFWRCGHICLANFHRWIDFPHADFAMCSSKDFQHWPIKYCFVWKWLLCSCASSLHYWQQTIDLFSRYFLQVWNDMTISKWSHSFHFCMLYPFMNLYGMSQINIWLVKIRFEKKRSTYILLLKIGIHLICLLSIIHIQRCF